MTASDRTIDSPRKTAITRALPANAVKHFIAVGREPSGVVAEMKNRRARALPLKPQETHGANALQRYLPARWATASLAPLLIALTTGCSTLPSTRGLDLMNPASSLLSPGSAKNASPYQMLDGTAPATALAGNAGLTEEAYHKIREAKAQNAIVLQVAEDEQPVRVLPLPPGQKSVFVSELLNQTGVLKKLGSVQATLYRPSPDSISGVRMEIQFADDGTVDPTTDYGLRPGDRVQIQQKSTTAIESLVNMALRR